MSLVILLLVLAAVGWLALYLVELLVRRPVPAAWLILMLVVANELLDPVLISRELGGFRVSVVDVGFGLVLSAGVLRVLRIREANRGQLVIGLLCVMAILSLLLGFGGGDLANTFNEFRGYLGYLAAALYFSTVVLDRQIRERLAVAWLGAGIALGAVILVRWAGRLAGTDLGLIDRTYDAAIRVLNGPSSFFVASAGLVLLLPALESWASRPRLQRYTGIALLVMAIILNRRTVWLALVMALVILLARRGQVGRRLALVAAVGLVLFLALIPVLTEPEAEQSVAAAITDTGTLAWRIEGWTALLETGPDSAPERLIGEPFGSGFQRDIRGNVRESNPHSFYVQTYLRTGVIGLGALVAALWIGFTGAFRAGKDEAVPLSNEHLLVLLAMQAIWFLAWPPGPDQGIILGLAVASAAMSSQSALEERRAKLAVG